MSTKTGRLMTLAICTLLMTPVFAYGQQPGKPSSDSVSPGQLAKEVYDHLLKEYREGHAGIERVELLHNWSVRILQTEFDVTEPSGLSQVEIAAAAMKDHASRMRHLEKQVAALVRAGAVPKAELTAARFFRTFTRNIDPMIMAIHSMAEKPERKIQLQLPETSETRALSKPAPTIVVNVNKDGDIYVAGKKLGPDALFSELKQHAAKNRDASRALIRADHQCRFDAIAEVMNLCKQAGLGDISFSRGDKEDAP